MDYPSEKIFLIVVDSNSKDRTAELAETFLLAILKVRNGVLIIFQKMESHCCQSNNRFDRNRIFCYDGCGYLPTRLVKESD